MTPRPETDIEKIAALLKAANDAGVAEIETEIPYYLMTDNSGKITVKARWRR